MLNVLKGKRKNGRSVVNLEIDGKKRLATRNFTPGKKTYDEMLVTLDGIEYRIWDQFRSKLAAALINGLKSLPLISGSHVLYLGVSTGTTASHISDIIGSNGLLFGVEIAQRVAREFIDRVVKDRDNVIPVVADARIPETYVALHGKVDLIYCDIAQQTQTEIAIKNSNKYLREGGALLLVVKSRSIDVTRNPKKIFKEEANKLDKSGFEVRQVVNLHPYDKDHAMIYAVIQPTQKIR